jgi:hypothetical protein
MASEIFCDLLGKPLLEGAWAEAVRWEYQDGTPIQRSYLWRVELRRNRRYLVAQETQQVLLLTSDRAKQVVVIQPSCVVSIYDYPSQWQAWRNNGWGVYLMDTFNKGIMISALRRRTIFTCRISGEDFAELLRTPGGMEEFLMTSLQSAGRPRRKRSVQNKTKSPET